MIRLQITDDHKCWTRTFRRKGISFYLCIIINRLKGYKVEELWLRNIL